MKPPRHECREGSLTGVTEGGMTEVVPESDRIDQRVDEPQGARDLAGNGAHFEGMRESRTNVGIARNRDDLGLSRQTPKRARTEHPISIAPESLSFGKHTEHKYTERMLK